MTADYGQLVEKESVWVLTVNENIGGLIILRKEPDHVLISNMAVATTYQRHGFGRRLLEFAEAHARQNEVDELRLYTNELMHENLAIYSKLGWDEYDRAEQDGFRRIFMRKRLGFCAVK